MTTVHGTCTAFAGDILMPVSGFDDFAAEFTLYGVFDDFHHSYLLTEDFVVGRIALGVVHRILDCVEVAEVVLHHFTEYACNDVGSDSYCRSVSRSIPLFVLMSIILPLFFLDNTLKFMLQLRHVLYGSMTEPLILFRRSIQIRHP